MAKQTKEEKEREVYFDRVRRGKIDPIYVAEILEAAAYYKSKEEKAEVLLANDCPALREYLRLTFDPDIEWTITYKEMKKIKYYHMDIADYSLAPSTLHREWKRLKYLTTDQDYKLTHEKKCQLLANMFEVLHQPEIDLIKASMQGRSLPFTGVTEKLTRMCWPNIFKTVVKEEENEENEKNKISV